MDKTKTWEQYRVVKANGCSNWMKVSHFVTFSSLKNMQWTR